MNITDQQLKEIAIAGGLTNADNLEVKRSDNFFELGSTNNGKWISNFSLKFIIGPCSDRVDFDTNLATFDKDAARRKMENLQLIERL